MNFTLVFVAFGGVITIKVHWILAVDNIILNYCYEFCMGLDID